jgi:monofunctional glycosyltransferase
MQYATSFNALHLILAQMGVYGAEAAARYYYQTSAAVLTRERAARLAAVLPAPRTRTPQRMDASSARILTRMRQMGW